MCLPAAKMTLSTPPFVQSLDVCCEIVDLGKVLRIVVGWNFELVCMRVLVAREVFQCVNSTLISILCFSLVSETDNSIVLQSATISRLRNGQTVLGQVIRVAAQDLLRKPRVYLGGDAIYRACESRSTLSSDGKWRSSSYAVP